MSNFRHVETAKLDWQPIGTHGLRCKRLAYDEATGGMFNYLDIPEGWHGGGIAHYHQAFEEVYILSGSVTLGAGRWFVEGDYFYRPAMVVHGHDEQSITGSLALVRSDGPLALNLIHEPAEPDEYPLEDKDPRGHVLQRPVESVAWQTLDGFPDSWEMRLLSHNVQTGALSAMARIPAGWMSTGPIDHQAPWSAYVIEGILQAGDTILVTGDFADGQAGTGPIGPSSSESGATLLLWFDANKD